MLIEIIEDVAITNQDREYIEQAISTVLNIENLDVEGEVSVHIVDDQKIKFLNKEYRNKDSITDVLSFPMYENMEEIREADYLVLGDIIINLEQVARQALEFNHPYSRELVYLTIHSMYHLLGYDHILDDQKKQMREKEEFAYMQWSEL